MTRSWGSGVSNAWSSHKKSSGRTTNELPFVSHTRDRGSELGRLDHRGGALRHGVVSRVVSADELESVAHDMAERIASTPKVAVKLAKRAIGHLSRPAIRSSMDDELIYQTFLNRSDDFTEFRDARESNRTPHYRGS